MVQSVGKDRAVDFVFLYPPHPYDIDPNAQIGLGLLLLATYAKSLGASVRVINAQSMTLNQTLDSIPMCRNLMIYGCLIDASVIVNIIAMVRTAYYIYVGGPIAIGKDHDLSEKIAVVDGYGEPFIEYLISGGQYEDIQMRSINSYPFPDRSLIEGPYGGNIFKHGDYQCQTSTTLLTSRGCRYKCSFCTSGQDSFFEEYDLDRIEKELEHCLSLGIKDIRISDDNLMVNQTRLARLCQLFKEAKISWRGSIRVAPNNLFLYEMMAESGCKELSFGVESGDPDVLRLLNKGITVEQSRVAVENAKKVGIFTRALMMMGTPGETQDTVYLNMSWVEQAKPDMVSLKMFVPYPGTDIYHNPKKYKCKVHLPLADTNNSAYRPDRSQPVANIDSEKQYQEELSWNFLRMKSYLETRGIENRG